MKPMFVLLFTLCVALAACNSPSSQTNSSGRSSDSGILTNEKAQRALDRFAQQQQGSIKIKGGIQEIPAQNIATAECESENVHFNRRGEDRIITGNPKCTVGFTHYTDGRWVLTRVTIGGFEAIEWKPSIEVN